METLLSVERLGKRFRGNWLVDSTDAVVDVSFAIDEGEVVGLLGPNGAGKTTTFRAVTGLVRPTSGRISLFGRSPRDRMARSRLGFLPEEAYFHDFLTGEECVDLAARLTGVPAAERRSRVAEVLGRVGLDAARKRRLRTYSKGMKQRVGIAQAIVGRPALVILDEPMTGLDPIGRREIRDLIQALPGEGTAVIFSTHVLQDVELACHRVVILAGGRVRRQGRLADLLGVRGEALDVTIRGLSAEAARSLEGSFEKAQPAPGGVTFRVADAASAERLRAAAVAQGGLVAAMVPVQRTLEDAFLEEVAAT